MKAEKTKYRLFVSFDDGAWDIDEYGEIRTVWESFEELYETEEKAKEQADYYREFYGDKLDFAEVDEVPADYIIR